MSWYFLFCFLVACECYKIVTLAGTLNLNNTNSVPYINMVNRTLFALDYFVNTINQKNWTIEGEPIKFQLDIRNDLGSLPLAINIYKELLDNVSINFVFVPWGPGGVVSTWSVPIVSLAEPKQRIALSTLDSTSTFWSNRSYAFSNTFSVHRRYFGSIPLLRTAKAKTAVFIRANRTTCSFALSDDFSRELYRNDITVINTFEFGIVPEVNESKPELKNIIAQVIKLDPDVIFFCPYYFPATRVVLEVLEEFNWLPRAIFSSFDSQFIPDKKYNFVSGFVNGNSRLRYPDDDFYGNFSTLSTNFKQMYNITFSDPAPAVLIMGHLLSVAIRNAKTLENDIVATQYARQRTQTFLGEFLYSVDHEVLAESLTVQFINDVQEIIAPLSTKSKEFEYPMPTWEERIFNPKLGDGKEDLYLVVFISIGIFISLAWLIVLAIFRQHSVIVAASPLFLLAMTIGTFLLYLSILSWITTILSDVLCHLRFWFLDLGFVLLFGSLFLKTWRIYVLFMRKDLTIFKISNLKLSLMLAAVISIHLILLIIISTKSDVKVSIVHYDPYRPKYDQYQCSSNSSAKILTWILIGLNAIMFGFGSFLAFYVKNVPYEEYDESKVIAASIYNCGFFAIFVIAFQLSSSKTFLIHIMSGLLTFLGASSTISVVFFHKLLIIKSPDRNRLMFKHSIQTNPSSGTKEDRDSEYGHLMQLYELSESNLTKYKELYALSEAEVAQYKELYDVSEAKRARLKERFKELKRLMAGESALN